MNVRDIVIETMAHRQPPTIPYRVTFMPAMKTRLQKELGLPDLDRSLGNYLVHLHMLEPTETIEAPDGPRFRDEFGCVFKLAPDGGPYLVEYPLQQASPKGHEFPDPWRLDRFDRWPGLLKDETDRFVLFSFDRTLFERAHFMRGMEDLFVDLLTAPGYVHDLLDRILAFNLVVLERASDYPIDGVIFADDYGSQNGLLISPKHWREFIKPRLAQEFALLKKRGKVAVLHSCGDVQAIIPDLIEIGLDCLNPVQPETMDLELLKREYGRDLCFYGGISAQKTLPFGSPDQVREEVCHLVDMMGRDGGYIVAPAIHIQTDTPTANVVALLDTLQERQ